MIGGYIGAAVGALGGVLGGISKNNAIKKQLSMIAEAERDNQNWFDRRYNEDSTQRADAQRLLTMTEDSIRKRNKAAAGTAAVMGATDESVAAEKEVGNKLMADAVSQVHAAGQARKDQIENQYLQRKNSLENMRRQLTGEKSNTLDLVKAGIGGAANGFEAGMGIEGMFTKKQS